MTWLFITFFAYFFAGSATILDKFLLSSKKVSHPAIYTFYVGLFSCFAFLFIPFGFHVLEKKEILIAVLGGIIYNYGLFALFSAIEKDEASRVMPVVGAVIPVVTYFLSIFLLEENLNVHQFFGVVLLILGGLIISLDFHKKNRKDKKRKHPFFETFLSSILAGFLLALSYTLFKKLYNQDSFLNVFIWTRGGAMLGALSLFLFSPWRKVILKSLKRFKKTKKQDYHHGILFALAKSTAGLSSFLLNLAFSLGSVTVVNALIALQYSYIFILEIFLAAQWPKVFKVKRDSASLIQKSIAIVIISLGLFFVSTNK